jgi:hypothetical protein
MGKIVFLCGARDFHAIDWYRSAKSSIVGHDVVILTDLVSGEGYKKLVNDNDIIFKLIILDSLLFNNESKFGNYWRNFLKLLFFPVQLCLVIRFKYRNPDSVYHAHSMYYLWLAWAARLNFIGTPQGSDILVKPYKSILYRYFSKIALRSAKYVTVDSNSMANSVFLISGISPCIIQNGIDLSSILNSYNFKKPYRDKVISIRGFASLYCLEKILEARNNSSKFQSEPITFIYPFVDSIYKDKLSSFFRNFDFDIGRLEKNEMYDLLFNSFLVISIPQSDSSPRSVYEAIFCGCAVAIRYNPFYDDLPKCMKSRIILIDFNNPNWFDDSINSARIIVESDYVPSLQALNDYDQLKSSAKMIELLLK